VDVGTFTETHFPSPGFGQARMVLSQCIYGKLRYVCCAGSLIVLLCVCVSYLLCVCVYLTCCVCHLICCVCVCACLCLVVVECSNVPLSAHCSLQLCIRQLSLLSKSWGGSILKREWNLGWRASSVYFQQGLGKHLAHRAGQFLFSARWLTSIKSV
jgi:hypothetical protein